MSPFRKHFVSMVLLAGATDASNADPVVDSRFRTLDELAKAIAHTIDVSFPKNPNGPMRFVGADPHGNIVEVHWISDAAGLTAIKAASEKVRRFMGTYLCDGERRPYLNAGVVIHYILASPDGRDRFEFSIDRTTCISLPPTPEPADSKTLIERAQAIARAENEKAASGRSSNSPIQFESASARENIVEMSFVVADPNLGRGFAVNGAQLRGMTHGFSCGGYGNDLRRGLSMHWIYKLPDGHVLFDFAFDKSSC